jgi:hypothetical protein
LFGDGGELCKATGHGADEDYERVLFCETNGGGGGGGGMGHSTAVEVRDWAREHEARNTERIN